MIVPLGIPLPVVDASGAFLGMIPAHRLLAVLLAEHHEDMARLSGLLKSSLCVKTSLEERIAMKLYHRLPWLLVGLVGVAAAAGIVASFERELQQNIALAFFLPGIVYLADAVGTQTETLVVRGLSLGLPILRIAWQEFLTGFLVGAVLAAACVPMALWHWAGTGVALVLALSVMATCSCATLIAIALPLALDRLGLDPAFGSGPMATLIQDLLSVSIYLAMGSLL